MRHSSLQSVQLVDYEALWFHHNTLSDSETSLPGLSFSVWLWDTLSKSWNEWTQHITLCPPIGQLASKSNAPQAYDTIAGCLWSYKHTTQSHCVHFSSECSVHQTGTEEQLWLYMIWCITKVVWMCVWMWVHDAFSRPSRIWRRKFSTYSLSLKLWMQPHNLWHRMWGQFAIAVVKHCWSSVMWDTNKLWRYRVTTLV